MITEINKMICLLEEDSKNEMRNQEKTMGKVKEL